MRLASIALALPALLATYVSAHGFVSQVDIDGTSYAGNIPGKYEGASPIRMISTISPVTGADATSSENLNCGMDAQLAEIDAPASPGSTVTFQWSGGADGGQDWPHNVGPLMTYMASCGGDSCTSYNGSGADFFKIAQIGQETATTWYQNFIKEGYSYTVTLPSNIEPGAYLIRHEIIALQGAMAPGGAEFYPSCTQVKISGSGTGTPSDTVHFPGGYSEMDTGIYVNVYDFSSSDEYVFPGPVLSNLAQGGEGEISSALKDTNTFPSSGASVTASATVSAVAVPSGTDSSGSGGSGSGSGTTMMSGSATSAASAPVQSQSGGDSGTSAAVSATPTTGGFASTCRLKTSASTAAATPLSKRFHDRVMRRMRRPRVDFDS